MAGSTSSHVICKTIHSNHSDNKPPNSEWSFSHLFRKGGGGGLDSLSFFCFCLSYMEKGSELLLSWIIIDS